MFATTKFKLITILSCQVSEPIEEKTEVGIDDGDCTSTDKRMEQLFARLKTIEAKLRTQQQSLDFVCCSTENLASSLTQILHKQHQFYLSYFVV